MYVMLSKFFFIHIPKKTYVGSLLVSLNPYKQIPMYSEEWNEYYSSIRSLSDAKPHVFAVATEAYYHMLEHRTNHSILIK